MQNQNYSMAETAKILNLSYRTIQRLIENKKISYHHLGGKRGKYWFTDDDIQEFQNSTLVKAGA